MSKLHRPMANDNKPDTHKATPWTRSDEENLLLDISEDRRLVRLGIDPDANSLDIWLQLRRGMKEIERRKAERPSPCSQ